MKIKIYISTNYIVEQRSDKCRKHENVKKRAIKNRLDRAFRLSSNWSYFSEECDRLKMVFSRLDYPDKLVNYTITRFIAYKTSDQPTSRLPAATNGQDPVRLVLPFKDQVSADIVRTQLNDLSQKIHKTIQPVFVSQKINQHLKLREAKPPLVNQQSLVYPFKCDCAMQVMLALHDGTYINAWTNIDTLPPLLARISVTNTLRHRKISNFTILKKCNSKFDYLTAMRCSLLTN